MSENQNDETDTLSDSSSSTSDTKSDTENSREIVEKEQRLILFYSNDSAYPSTFEVKVESIEKVDCFENYILLSPQEDADFRRLNYFNHHFDREE